ncbi:PTS lactose/cellobiose transporter subunit IIA [uncultured Collinsella sp.]|uniref:PTS lactose/cellobiose transporter subunit IIA n=1 Tax=Collinsella sp. BM28 TaxID=3378285 RepID=UPI0025E22D00|nr:PTS lactose/cellobiose transporter subunit IIA [uncultured Collinsella sp.]
MATKEEISMIGFEIVAYAGDAQTDLIAACEKAREGDIEEARRLQASAHQALIDAHDVQTRLLSQEAGGGEMDVTFIMVHAQDTLMTTMMLEKQATFTIDAYERLAALEARHA